MPPHWKYPNISRSDKPIKSSFIISQISILDHIQQKSPLNQSGLRGWFNLLILFGFIYICSQSVANFVEKGYFLTPKLYNYFKKDLIWCLMIWPLFFLWTFTAFILQKLILIGLPSILTVLIHHSTQTALFVFGTYIVITNKWCATHTAFVVMQACVHFMKMHSYTLVNRDYRQQYLEAIKNNEKVLSDYPKNINIKEFVLFMFTPWLVYDKYPRKNSVRITYIVKKAIFAVCTLLAMYVLWCQCVLPWVQAGKQISYLQLMFRQILPSILFILMGFYLVFECMNNIFAEITKLENRQFYQDWWNATTYQQFNRLWNKPVHNFLYRHVYLQIMLRWKCSKGFAMFCTFMFSALLHQYLLSMMLRTVRFIFLGFIMLQVPVIYMTRFMRGTRNGNYLFWFGLVIGPPLIICSILRSDDQVAAFFTRED